MIKKLLATLLLAGCMHGVSAQQTEKDSNSLNLLEEITGIKKKTDKFNFYLHMNGSFDANFNDEGLQQSNFKMRQFRIEARGNINDWLSYRYRQRLNRSNSHNGFDNMSTSIDYAAIGVKLNSKWNLLIGKQCTNYGGYEFDMNPVLIYQYSDMIDNLNNFMWGVNVGYNIAKGQQVNVQIANGLNTSWESMYGGTPTDGLEMAKLPLVYTVNWISNFNNVFKTRWSASVRSQADGKKRYYYALGNELTLGKFDGYFDVMYAKDDIDRSGIITGMVGKQGGHNAYNAEYLSLVSKLNYHFTPKWNMFVKGMYETASVSKQTTEIEKGKYRTSLGYLVGLEYYPLETGLHFFLAYVGRSYKFEDRAKALGFENYETNRVSVGFIYPLQMF